MAEDLTFPICTACGSQYDLPEISSHYVNCKICDDPRQFVPPSGQSWTTLRQLSQSHRNIWEQDQVDSRIWFVHTEPKFAIGQRAILLQTPDGNVLWDCITLLDKETIEFINRKGGLEAIIISHPHYYTTYAEWAETFKCPVLISVDDREWLRREPPKEGIIKYIEGPAGSTETVVNGVTAIKTGGHFPGSLVLNWERKLLIADTIVTVPSAYTPHQRPKGQTSYAFQWSIPNMIPLPPNEILQIWQAIKPFDFDTTHGAFVGMDVRDEKLKGRMLESMKIQTRAEGWHKHEILDESLL